MEISPVEVQVIACVVPACQELEATGEVTVNVLGIAVISKYAEL